MNIEKLKKVASMALHGTSTERKVAENILKKYGIHDARTFLNDKKFPVKNSNNLPDIQDSIYNILDQVIIETQFNLKKAEDTIIYTVRSIFGNFLK